MEKANEWQNRSLDAIYPIIFMDATVLKIRVDRVVKNIAAYIMLGITLEGKKEIIGIWIGENETSKYWLTVLNDLNSGWKDRKAVAKDLKPVYSALSEEDGQIALTYFNDIWGKKYPNITMSWTSHWAELSTFFKYPDSVRKLIYTTNPIELVLEVGMRFFLNLVYFSVKLCQNILSDYWIRGGFTQLDLHSPP